jgi:hypothetical protein
MTDPKEIAGPLGKMTVRVASDSYRPSWTPPRPTHFAWAGLNVDLRDAAGRGEGASGLAFDQLVTSPPDRIAK